MESHRLEDSRQEQEVSKFLDRYFYGNPRCGIAQFKRFDDRVNQLCGADIQIKIGSEMLICDEKAQVNGYVNRDIPTFCLELEFLDRNQHPQEGWFIDKTKRTDMYVLIYVWAHGDFCCDNIGAVKVILIRKAKILEFLHRIGVSFEQIQSDIKRIREDDDNGLIKKYWLSEGLYYTISNQLLEKPINLIVPRYLLEALADRVCMIKRKAYIFKDRNVYIS